MSLIPDVCEGNDDKTTMQMLTLEIVRSSLAAETNRSEMVEQGRTVLLGEKEGESKREATQPKQRSTGFNEASRSAQSAQSPDRSLTLHK